MILRKRSQRDPFWDDGQGVRKMRTRQRITDSMAFAVAVVACGLTAAAWMRELGPVLGGLHLG